MINDYRDYSIIHAVELLRFIDSVTFGDVRRIVLATKAVYIRREPLIQHVENVLQRAELFHVLHGVITPNALRKRIGTDRACLFWYELTDGMMFKDMPEYLYETRNHVSVVASATTALLNSTAILPSSFEIIKAV